MNKNVVTAMFTLSIAFCLVGSPVAGQNRDSRLDRLGPPVKVFEAAERDYRSGKYDRAHKQLSDAWKKSPAGTPGWQQYEGVMQPLLDETGINVGRPPCYSALRMLTECAAWRVRQPLRSEQVEPHSIQLAVLLVARGKGNSPANLTELKNGAGQQREFVLNEVLPARDHAIIHESLWLFLEYITAITDGRLKVETRIVQLDMDVKLQAREEDIGGRMVGRAGLVDNNAVWQGLDPAQATHLA